MPQPLKMQVRKATALDIPALADIGFKAFFNEPIDGHWFPLKEKYPYDYHRSFIDDFTLRLVTPGNVVIVLEVEDTKDTSRLLPDQQRTQPRKKLTAYLIMVKHGPTPQDLAHWNPDTPLNKLTRTFLNLPNSDLPNRAMSPETITNYYAQAEKAYNQHLDTPASEQKWINCQFLAVDPAYQRRGCGEKLIEWVSATAAREDVPVFLDSTDIALPLYLRHAARRIGKIFLPARVVDSGDGTEHTVKLEALEVVLLKWRAEWEVVSKSRL